MITILHQNTSMELIVYSAFWCPDCRAAKRFLARHNIPYKEIDIETTPGAAQEVIRRTGKRAIPQFVIDGEWVQPYRPGEGFLTKRCPNSWASNKICGSLVPRRISQA